MAKAAPAEVVSAAVRLAEARRKGSGEVRAGRPDVARPDRRRAGHRRARRAAQGRAVPRGRARRRPLLRRRRRRGRAGGRRRSGARRRRRRRHGPPDAVERGGLRGRPTASTPSGPTPRRSPIPDGSHLHVDPDRRVEGSRRAARCWPTTGRAPTPCSTWPDRAVGGAIKLGPASDFDAHFYGDRFEVELVSLAGECKEATAWFGDLASCRRRATRLPEARPGPTSTARPAASPRPDRWRPGPSTPTRPCFAPAWSSRSPRRTDLGRISDAADFLTGPDRLDSPFLAALRGRRGAARRREGAPPGPGRPGRRDAWRSRSAAWISGPRRCGHSSSRRARRRPRCCSSAAADRGRRGRSWPPRRPRRPIGSSSGRCRPCAGEGGAVKLIRIPGQDPAPSAPPAGSDRPSEPPTDRTGDRPMTSRRSP